MNHMALKNQPFQKLAALLKGVAPTAVAALAGPYAPLAAGVIRQVLNVEAADDEALSRAVAAAVADPATVAKLKEIEAAMKQHESDLGLQFEQLAGGDRADAGARQSALKDNMPAQVFYLLTIGFFGSLAFMFVRGLPAAGGEPLLLMIGSLGTAWSASVAYFVGSSAGSKAKTDLLAK